VADILLLTWQDLKMGYKAFLQVKYVFRSRWILQILRRDLEIIFSWVQTGEGSDWVGGFLGVAFGFRIWCCFSIYLIDFQMFKTDKFVLELVFL
jgi:hypothetical protein